MGRWRTADWRWGSISAAPRWRPVPSMVPGTWSLSWSVRPRVTIRGTWKSSSRRWCAIWRPSTDVVAVGVGAAGWMDLAGGTVLFSRLAWRNEPLRDNLQRLLGRPVTVVNDADAAAWGEFRFGAGAGGAATGVYHLGHGHWRSDGDGRPAGAGPLGHCRGIRAPGHHARGTPLRVRKPRLLGAIRLG